MTYTYDALNRLTLSDYPGTAEDVTYAYDTGVNCPFGLGRPCQVSDASGVTQFAYDAFGNVTEQRKTELGIPYLTRYGYDAGNRLVSMIYPDGRAVNYTRDALGRVTAVTTTDALGITPVANSITYRADGLVTAQTFGNGLSETRTYDLQGRLTQQTRGLEAMTYGYDLNGNVTATTPLLGPSTFGYDALDRLTEETLAGLPYQALCDANGNRVSATAPGHAVALSYDAASNRLAGLTVNAIPEAVSLDAAGIDFEPTADDCEIFHRTTVKYFTDLYLEFGQYTQPIILPKGKGEQSIEGKEEQCMAPDIMVAFFQTAKKYPHQSAIRDDGKEISYSQLESLVFVVAERLGTECGVVGVIATHSTNNVVALLAVLAAGGTYCPIGAEYPLIKQQSLVQEAECDTVIVTQKNQYKFGEYRVIDLTDISMLLKNKIAVETELISSRLDNPAYILFTSGSTGKPKPVVTSRLAISTVTTSLNKLFALQSSDRVLQFASLNWDTCFEEIFPALTTGATLVLDNDAYQGSMARLLRLIHAAGITILNFPTAFWHELVYHLHEDQLSLPASVHTLIIGGEAVQTSRLADWCELESEHIRLINTYGSTETTLITHAIDLHGPVADKRETSWRNAESVPIGKCLVHVHESISTTGELLIGGSALATGYKGLPEETQKRFCYVNEKNVSGRFFCTGDRVRRDGKGVLFHLGRLDNQLKIRGVRVEPGAVEAEILKLSDVSMVAVVGDTIAHHTRLIAYVVPRCFENSQSLSDQIYTFLRKNVPNYLIPAAIRMVSQFDYTASGKIDRSATHKNYHPNPKPKEVFL